MKVRFGYTIGPETDELSLGHLVDDLERLGFDLIWVPEILLSPTLDPIVALSFAAARTTRLKLGAHLVLPGRHPVQLAKQLVQLDRLSGGRLFMLAVLGVAQEADIGAQGIDRRRRASALEEMLPLMRRLWSGETVDHAGEHFRLEGVRLPVVPLDGPLEVWLGGQVTAALDRCGRVGEGWMPGGLLPHEAAEKKALIDRVAADNGRTVDPEHFGVNLYYAFESLPTEVAQRFAARRSGRPGEGLVPVGIDALHRRIDEWLEAGFSKFLLRPAVPPDDPSPELELLAREILPRTS